MFCNHPVSDLVARIKNGYMANKSSIHLPFSKLRENILQILKQEGYILNYIKVMGDAQEKFDVHLKYHYSSPAVNEIEVISKPGRRVYCSVDKIPLVKSGLGIVVLSTPGGIISDHQARDRRLGGEILFKVF